MENLITVLFVASIHVVAPGVPAAIPLVRLHHPSRPSLNGGPRGL